MSAPLVLPLSPFLPSPPPTSTPPIVFFHFISSFALFPTTRFRISPCIFCCQRCMFFFYFYCLTSLAPHPRTRHPLHVHHDRHAEGQQNTGGLASRPHIINFVWAPPRQPPSTKVPVHLPLDLAYSSFTESVQLNKTQ